MHFVPFIYFSALTYYFWQKHRVFDVAVYISLLFTVTSFFCIVMVQGGFTEGSGVLIDGWEVECGIAPTFLYCALVTLTIFPFSLLRPEQFRKIGNIHRYVIFALAIFIMLQGLVVFYLVADSIQDILSGDFKYLKDSVYDGDITPADAKMMTMPLPVQMMYLFCTITLLGIPLFFYYSCVEKRSLWLTAPLLVASVSPVLRGILGADRTEIIHFGLMFLFCVVLFQKFILRKVRNFLLTASIPVVLAASVYIFAVSASRFDESDEGTHGSLIEYAGQSFLNFCYVYDNHNPDLYYFEREFPFTSYILFDTQYTDTKEERRAKEGFFIGVFASHIGSWFLDGGLPGSIIISVAFALLCCAVIRQYDRTEFDIAEIFMIFIFGAVPTFGIFYYRYYSIATAAVYVAAILLFFYSKIDFVWGEGTGDASTTDNEEDIPEAILNIAETTDTQ